MTNEFKKKILLFIIVLIGAFSTIAFSYAYFYLVDTEVDQTINTETAKMTLIYNECADVLDNECGTINKDLKPGEFFKRKFSIENTGTRDMTIPLYFKSLKNTFKNDELIYSIKDVSNDIVLITAPVPYHEDLKENIEAYPNLFIEHGKKSDYELTVTFISTSDDQNYNVNAEYYMKLGLLELP